MWKRLNNQRGARPPAQQDQDRFDDMIYGEPGFEVERKAPPRPARDMEPRGRKPLNSNPVDHRDSRFRPPSSIYSQPSPNPIVTRFQNPYPNYPEEEVSPPSSPDIERPLNRSQQQADVSPIDEMPDVSRLSVGGPSSRTGSQPSSSIPVLRKDKRRNQIAAAAQNLVQRKEIGDGTRGRIAHDPRWDPYTGEITTSDKGKPQSTKPGQFETPGLRPVHKQTGIVLGNQSSVTAGAKAHTSFSDRVRRLGAKDTIAERPEWKGATGRHAVVSPVRDQHVIAPISIPHKSSKRVASPHSGSESEGSPVTIVRSGDGETSPASAQPDASIRTVLDSGRNTPRVVSPVAPLAISRTGNTYPENDATSVPARKGFEREDTLAGIERNFREAFEGVSTPVIDPYEQPPSRFSVTTYAPSEAQSTPRLSAVTELPPMPPPISPPPVSHQFQEPSSILERKRPQTKGESTVTRKVVNPTSPVFINMSSTIARTKRTPTTSSVSKTLPMSPAEAASHDLVTQLQAQLDNLAHRRNNITRSIRQMTELMPKDNVILTDQVRKKREDEKRKVEMLREEEADVKKEEHEIGLRLHRAWKRKDKDAFYEPTGLWVRRVTG